MDKTLENYHEYLKILTVNCQGLGDYKKRRDVLNYLHKKNYNIYFLQDTHFTKDEEKIILSQWGYKGIFNSYQSNSRGVAILFRNNFEFQLKNTVIDNEGNFIIAEIIIEKKLFTLINVYGPNEDRPHFYCNLFKKLETLSNENIIMAGDFNLVMDQKLDTMNYKNLNNPKARMELIQLMENENLCDIFRFLNPDKMKYTWRKKNPIKQSRLDYFLISESLVPSIQVVDHENSYRSDHTPVVLTLKLTEFKHGKGFWKFNNSLLKDREYVNLVKSQIKETKMQYAALVYQLENINELNNAEIEFRVPDYLFLDTLLMNIRGKTISYSTYKKKMQKETQSNLENEIKLLEENFNEESLFL